MFQGPLVTARSLTAALALAAGALLLPAPACAQDVAASQAGGQWPLVLVEEEQPSAEVRRLQHWIVKSGDNAASPFVIVDKVAAKVYVFHRDGRQRAVSPALLGLARGDDTVPGIGRRPIATIRPDERTTPAGRFVASLAGDGHGDEVLWVDYDAAVALHRVVDIPRERRLQRLASGRPPDRRITYGCINVSAKFFDTVVRPAFRGTGGIVYVLPEIRSPRQVFGSSGD